MTIYDCFTFFNEIDLLKLRLEMLDHVVDKFVIVETNKTFHGIDKPYNFINHKNEFYKYLNKIIYINPDDIPIYKGDGDWDIEYYSRNSIMKGLTKCEPDDIIIVSDIDEIPNIDAFLEPLHFNYSKFPDRSFRGIMKSIYKYYNWQIIKPAKNWLDLLEYSPVACQQDLYYYFLNCKSESKWFGSVICKYKNIKTTQFLRKIRGSIPYIKNGGWHLSYFGGIDSIKEKTKAIIDDRKEVIQIIKNHCDDDDYIKHCIKNGIDLYHRENVKFKYIDFNEISFPNKKKVLEKYPHFYNNDIK